MGDMDVRGWGVRVCVEVCVCVCVCGLVGSAFELEVSG